MQDAGSRSGYRRAEWQTKAKGQKSKIKSQNDRSKCKSWARPNVKARMTNEAQNPKDKSGGRRLVEISRDAIETIRDS
jgi:hypothetical protein